MCMYVYSVVKVYISIDILCFMRVKIKDKTKDGDKPDKWELGNKKNLMVVWEI